MISLASLKRASAPQPPRLLLYGTAKIGKTSFAASAPDPVFIFTENGVGALDVPHWGPLATYDEVMEAIGSLYSDAHGFKTVVLDSLDWLERLVWAKACQENKWQDIEQAGYGKGYVAAVNQWMPLLQGFDALQNERGMGVIFIAHYEIKRFESPETEPYDRYQPKLHKLASPIVQEHVDAILFANYRVSTVKTDGGFNKRTVRGVGGGDRLIHTTERPAFIAGNRWKMPDQLPLDWHEVAQHIPFYANS